MCAIVGVFSFIDKPIYASEIAAMTKVVAHRGPDGDGCYIDKNIGLGHRRLAILDLSTKASQPMATKDGQYILTYNGEVYNFQTIRAELEQLDHQFVSNSDSEVILKSYLEWGEACVNKFNGMFAFAIWDKYENKLFIARDRYGIKPIYYYLSDTCFIFASEIKSILESKYYTPKLNKPGLLQYLTFQNFFDDSTLFSDIKVFKAGHYAYIYPNGNFLPKKYWDFNFSSSLNISKPDAISETNRLFTQAVKRQLVSDVEVNSYLSGGIDSGAIAMVASKNLPSLKTFTIGFDLSSASGLELSFDERENAEYISYLAKSEHYEMVLKAGDMERCMPKFTRHLEEPRVGQSYPNYYAAKLAGKFGKVILSGCGGDEIFGGYPWRYFYSNTNISFNDFISQYYFKWHRLLPNTKLKQLIAPMWDDVKDTWTKDIFANVFSDIRKEQLTPEDCFNFSMYLEAKTFLPGLLMVEDKLSMANSLETRIPFLDNDLVDFATSLPMHHKITDACNFIDENNITQKKQASKMGKLVLRQALSSHLDDKILKLPKQGFSSPDASWFRGESIEFVKSVFKESELIARGIFSADYLQEYLDEHFSGKSNHRLFIWSFLNLESSIREFF